MTDPALLTKHTIWVALALYFWCEIRLCGRTGSAHRGYRPGWTIACVFYVAHVACAFAFHHSWSHELAYADTARQTEAVVGRRFGAGLWFNYLFSVLWIADVVRLWCRRDSKEALGGWVGMVWRGMFLFIVFNATVVFENGAVRWLGLLGCVGVVLNWWQCRRM